MCFVSPHDFLFAFLLLLLPHHDRLDDGPLLGREVREVGTFLHRLGVRNHHSGTAGGAAGPSALARERPSLRRPTAARPRGGWRSIEHHARHDRTVYTQKQDLRVGGDAIERGPADLHSWGDAAAPLSRATPGDLAGFRGSCRRSRTSSLATTSAEYHSSQSPIHGCLINDKRSCGPAANGVSVCRYVTEHPRY